MREETDKMLKIENVETFGWEAAIRGMRNPMNSWEKTDSYPAVDCRKCGKIEREGSCTKEDRDCTGFECFEVGPNDLKLMTTLRNAGTDHRKFMRMITVYLDITAPLYWWKEFDTYKVGTVANSCSTMHKIADKEFVRDDFSYEHLFDFMIGDVEFLPIDILDYTIDCLNLFRERYLATKDKEYWWQMIQLLPSSYNQRRTVMLNYEILANIYKSRKNHKLDEWCVHDTPKEHDFRNKDFSSGMWGFCDWIENLPYSVLITGGKSNV